MRMPAFASKVDRAIVFRNYRNQIVSPAVRPRLEKAQLPWAWLAAHADRNFSQSAFALWWQLRVFGITYPRKRCVSCSVSPLAYIYGCHALDLPVLAGPWHSPRGCILRAGFCRVVPRHLSGHSGDRYGSAALLRIHC